MCDDDLKCGHVLWCIAQWSTLIFLGTCLFRKIQWLPGLTVGAIGGIFNFLLLYRQIKHSAKVPTAIAVLIIEGGWLIRLLIVGMMLLLSVKIPQINFLTALAEFFAVQVIVIFAFFRAITRD